MRSKVAATLPVSIVAGTAAAATGTLPASAPRDAHVAGAAAGAVVDLAAAQARGQATQPGPGATATGR